MKNNKFRIKLDWINQDDFEDFLKYAKDKCQSGKPYTDTFCIKFSNGTELNWKFHFNQKDGFYFAE